MPKKSANIRSGTQRNKPKAQKNFELVRPEADVSEKSDTTDVPVSTTVSTPEKQIALKKQASALEPEERIAPKKHTSPALEEKQEDSETTLPKGSAAARMAARRRAAHKAQQRNAASLITAEHFAYVRRDLITIAILAFIMFAAIIVLYGTIGRV